MRGQFDPYAAYGGSEEMEGTDPEEEEVGSPGGDGVGLEPETVTPTSGADQDAAQEPSSEYVELDPIYLLPRVMCIWSQLTWVPFTKKIWTKLGSRLGHR